MPTSEDLKQEAKDGLINLLQIAYPTEVEAKRVIDCIIEAAVMEAVETMKGHSHFSPSETRFR